MTSVNGTDEIDFSTTPIINANITETLINFQEIIVGKICYRIKTFLKFVIARAFLFPMLVIISPIGFIVSEAGSCKESITEEKEFLKRIWAGKI